MGSARNGLVVAGLVLLLVSCVEVRTWRTPFFSTRLVGLYYETTDVERQNPKVIQLSPRLEEVTPTRYTFSGQARLDQETFALQGEEVARKNLTYIVPQTGPPPPGSKVTMLLLDEAGEVVYSICTESPETTYPDASFTFGLWTGDCTENERPPFAYATLRFG